MSSSKNSRMEIEFLAAIVTVFSILITVIYTGGEYGAWDATLAAFVLYIIWKYRSDFARDPHALIVIRVGAAMALMVAVMTALTSLGSDLVAKFHSPISEVAILRIFDWFYMAVMALFLLSFAYHPERGFLKRSTEQPQNHLEEV